LAAHFGCHLYLYLLFLERKMATTTGSDRLFVESLGTLTVGLGEGDDLYVIDGSGTGANSRITINDTGVNRVQLTGGLTIKSSLVASNTTVLTLSNDAEITISNAAGFSYIIGGTPGTGTGGTTQNYTQFVTTTLGAASVPTTGSVSGTANKTIANTTTPSTLPTLSIASATVAEGNTGTANLVFNVTLSAASTTPVTVAYATTGVTAVSGADFTATSGTLTIAADATTGTITVPVTGDTVFEANETLTVTLSNSSANATVLATASSATGTITNDDTNALPVITTPTTTPSAFIGQTTSVTGISFTDADDNAGFTVTVQASGASQISFSDLANVTAKNAANTPISTGESSNLITLSGTKANVNTALTKLQYSTNSTIPTTEALTVTVTDPNAGAATKTVTVNIGSALTLTLPSDSLVGSAGDDLFSGTFANFLAGDTLVGSTGSDKLTLTAVTGALPTLTTAATGIDVLDLTTDLTAGNGRTVSFNAASFGSTLTTVNFTTNNDTVAGSADSADTLTATTANAGTTFNMQNTSGALTITAINGTPSSTDAFTVNLAGGTTLANITGGASIIDILNINSNGSSANTVTTLGTLTADATVNLGGSQQLTITLPNADFATINGATATGKLVVDGALVNTTAGTQFAIVGGSAGDVLTGGMVATSISGGAGNDTIVGGSAADTIVGGTGQDSLTGGANAANTSTAANTFVFAVGDSPATARDTITDLKEHDKIMFGTALTGLTNGATLSTSSASTIYVDATNNRLVVGNDQITIPSITAKAAFTYNHGADGIVGTADDYLTVGAASLTTMNDELGTLTLAGKATATANVLMSAINAPTVNAATIGNNHVNKLVASNVTNAGISVTGSTSADSITGSPQADTIIGGIGADTLNGGAGSDVLTYADVTGATSHSLTNVSGMAINLSASAVTAADVAAAAVAAAGGGAIVLGGGAAEAGSPLAAGTVGYLATTAANSTITMVRDTVSNFEVVIGSALGDVIYGSTAAETITGGAGVDFISSGGGDDTITDYGTGGTDVINLPGTEVRAAAATIVTPQTSESYTSNAAGLVTFTADTETTPTAAWTLEEKKAAVQANATLSAANKVSIFTEGSDSYVYYAGATTASTDDQFIKITNGSKYKKITDSGTADGGIKLEEAGLTLSTTSLAAYAGSDAEASWHGTSFTHVFFNLTHVSLAGYTEVIIDLTAPVANTIDTAINGGTFTLLTASNANATAPQYGDTGSARTVTGAATNDLIFGGSGADTIDGGAGNDAILGGADADSITAGAGNDIISGGAGADTIVMGSNLTTADTIDGGADADTLTFTDDLSGTTDLDNVTNVETITLGDAVTSVTTVTALVGTTATLIVNGSGLTGTNTLTWNGAAETDGGKFSITGGAAGDTITGGTGADTITGGAGADTLTQAAADGADTFVFAATDSTIAASDSISNWTTGTTAASKDKLDLVGTPTIAANNAGAAGAGIVTSNASNIGSHSITNGLIVFDADGTYDTPLTLSSADDLTAAINYVVANITTDTETVMFDHGSDTYVFQNNTAGDVLVKLTGVQTTTLETTATTTDLAVFIG
jgi:Ca2+-binding RTX toxin-like protein